MKQFDFRERFYFSHGNAPTLDAVFAILTNRIVGVVRIVRATEQQDKNGIDYIVERKHGLPSLFVDAKIREKDFGKDDLALETWSSIDQKVGWTRDQTKQADYILWYWCDTGRFCLLPFVPLQFVFERLWREWLVSYPHAVQVNDSWQSQCVFVPRTVVMEAIVRWSRGVFVEDKLRIFG